MQRMSDGGKGSSPRPLSVAHEQFSKNWDEIFKKPPCKWIDVSDELQQCTHCGAYTTEPTAQCFKDTN